MKPNTRPITKTDVKELAILNEMPKLDQLINNNEKDNSSNIMIINFLCFRSIIETCFCKIKVSDLKLISMQIL